MLTWSFSWSQNRCDVNSWRWCYCTTLSRSKLKYPALTITDMLVTPTQVRNIIVMELYTDIHMHTSTDN